MRILITAGPTYEPIDPVRFIGNRSSGKLGAALAAAAIKAGHLTTVIAGPVAVTFAAEARRIDVETSQQMSDAVLREFTGHDLLIMAAAVSDFRPKSVAPEKIPRGAKLLLVLEPATDILAGVARAKRPDQRLVGFSLETASELERARRKLREKGVDLLVHNSVKTLASEQIEATLLYPDGKVEKLGSRGKVDFADILIQRSVALFSNPAVKAE
jgi:phosphopantothenoylcysteine decarboxylase / phosphopantothenate---cysteine ligase